MAGDKTFSVTLS